MDNLYSNFKKLIKNADIIKYGDGLFFKVYTEKPNVAKNDDEFIEIKMDKTDRFCHNIVTRSKYIKENFKGRIVTLTTKGRKDKIDFYYSFLPSK